MGFLTQDPTYIGGSAAAQQDLLGGYTKQQGVYDQARQQGLGYTARAANQLEGVDSLGMGTAAFDRYRQDRITDLTRSPYDLVAMAQQRGPSMAEAQMQQGLGRIQSGNLAQAGAANNSALATRNALFANARAGADVATNAAVARAAEEAAYQQRILGAAQAANQARTQAVLGTDQSLLQQQQLMQQGALGLGNLGTAQQGLYTGAFQGQQQLNQNVQLTQAQMDAEREAANQQAIMGFVGNTVGGAASAVGNMYTGGALSAAQRGLGGVR